MGADYREHDWRPLTSSLGTNTKVKFGADGQAIIKTLGADAPVLDHNKDLRGLDDRGWIMGGGVRRVASIPAALIVKWFVEDGIDVFDPDHADRVMRKLNDPDYAYLRTAPGQLGLINGGESFR